VGHHRSTTTPARSEIMPARPGYGQRGAGAAGWQDDRVTEPTWTVVVPVKRLSAAKSRLRGALPGVPHEPLALALAQDTVSAALASPPVDEVLVVTDDVTAGRALRALGARVTADPPQGGLNRAFSLGASLVSGVGVAALTADLPALRPAELTAALRAAAAGPPRVRWFAADAPGTGTVLLLAPPGVPLDPRFGGLSAAAHAASGALALAEAGPTLRRDVDTGADLMAAAALGLGRYTAALLGAPPVAAPTAPARCTVLDMQGTVATYDPQTRSGTLLLDDGAEVAFPAAAFDASGLRLLRLGQRVRIEHGEAGEVTRITLPGLV
jgi:2-phospho-L-lactate/phosphoenolpyruvate guanylyltransferase